MLPTNRFFMYLSLIDAKSGKSCCAEHGTAWPYIYILVRTVYKDPEPPRARRMTQFSQHLGFDLADAFASNREDLPHFFERMIGAVIQAKTHADDSFLARRERLQHGGHLFLQIEIDGRVRGRLHVFILDEVAKVRLVFFSDGRFEGKGLLRNLLGLAHRVHGNVHALGNFFRSRLTPEFLHQLLTGANLLVDRLDHVHGNADGARLIRDGPGDGLANPPSGVGRKLVAAAPLEFVGTLHESKVAFLDQIKKLQPAIGVLFGDGHNEAKVGLGQFFLRLVGFRLAPPDEREGALQAGRPDLAVICDFSQLRAAGTQLLARFAGGIAARSGRAALQPRSLAFHGI